MHTKHYIYTIHYILHNTLLFRYFNISSFNAIFHAEVEKFKKIVNLNGYPELYNIVTIETPGGKRNLVMSINAQQAILNAYILNNSSLYKDFNW